MWILATLLLCVLIVTFVVRYQRLHASKQLRLVLERREVGDWVHEQIDSAAQDDEQYGPCLCCGAQQMNGHAVGYFNSFEAIDEIKVTEIWDCLRSAHFDKGRRIDVPGITDIRDYYFEIVKCPTSGFFAQQHLFYRGKPHFTLIHREIVKEEVASVIERWRALGSYTIISPKRSTLDR